MLDAPQDIQSEVKHWLAKQGRGASAKCIAGHVTAACEVTGNYPHDAGDFGRCEDLLTAFPSIRDRLELMAEVNSYWAALVPVWDEIKSSGDRTAAIKAVVGPIQAADPLHLDLGNGASVSVGKVSTGRTPMKNTPADDAVTDQVVSVAASQLKSIVERVERLEQEKKEVAEQVKEVMAEAKANGFDTKTLRKIITLRKKSAEDRSEEEAMLDLYKDALGMI